MSELFGLATIAELIRRVLTGFIPSPEIVNFIVGLVGIGGIFAVIFSAALVLVYAERKVSAFMQVRLGPNRVGPGGLLQTVADMLKLLSKEDIMPCGVDKWMWILAPILLFIPAAMVYVVFPFDKGAILADLNIGIFFVLAVSAQSTLPFLMAGWSSNSKYAVIGGMRTVAQMLSYEIPLVFSVLGIVMLAGSMRMSDIVAAQNGVWFILLQPFAFVIYVIAATAETNRAPFDLVEGESEIIAGPFTEYTGMRWAFFFLCEYANLVAVSAVAVTLFLGGWHGPFLPGWVWFFLKIGFMIFLFMWLRWTFPRFRIDQMMGFGWKVLLPLSLANVVVTGVGIFVYRLWS